MCSITWPLEYLEFARLGFANFALGDMISLDIISAITRISLLWATGTVFAYGVTSSGKTHTMHVSWGFQLLRSCRLRFKFLGYLSLSLIYMESWIALFCSASALLYVFIACDFLIISNIL